MSARIAALALAIGGCLVLALQDRGSLASAPAALIALGCAIIVVSLARGRVDATAVAAASIAALAHQLIFVSGQVVLAGAALVFIAHASATSLRLQHERMPHLLVAALVAGLSSFLAHRYRYAEPLVLGAATLVAGLLAASPAVNWPPEMVNQPDNQSG